MILTDDEVEDKLKSPDNLINKLKVIKINSGGRREGDTNIPPLVKELIATTASISEETGEEIGELFGISGVSVNAMRKGLTGGGNNASFDKELKDKIDKTVDKDTKDKIDSAHDAALDCLVGSLQLLGPRLKEVTKAKDLSKIANDMSKAISNLKKKDEDPEESKIRVVVFAPTQRKESHYKTFDV
jgi:hypothetical protein